MKSITLLSAVEQLAMLRESKISPLELAEEHIRAIEHLNPKLNAITDFDAERVREQARSLQLSKEPRGALYGLPVTIKSSIAVAGHRCEAGSLLRRGTVAERDAVIVSRMRRGGAVFLGTTNCPEFLMGYESDNSLYGRTCNPWDVSTTAGGSSGGEAAAIAAGMSAAGFGSDSGGSVRVPAHFTGICSLKPTSGRIPAAGHVPPCYGPFSILGAIGPMARTIEDVSFLFATLNGQDETDATSSAVPLRAVNEADLKAISIGYFEDDGLTPVTPETRVAVQDAVRALERRGFRPRPFRPKNLEAARKLWWKFFVRCGAMFVRPMFHAHEEQISPTLADFFAIAHREPPLGGDELLQVWAECDHLRGQLLREMREFPILICPACAIPAFRHGERSWNVEGTQLEYLDVMRYTQWFNLLASPAAVVPVSRSSAGLPIGVQIAGRPFEDEIVLAIASAIDKEFGFVAPA